MPGRTTASSYHPRRRSAAGAVGSNRPIGPRRLTPAKRNPLHLATPLRRVWPDAGRGVPWVYDVRELLRLLYAFRVPGNAVRTACYLATGHRLQERLRVASSPPTDHLLNLPRVADVRRRVGREDHQVGEFAGRDAAQVVPLLQGPRVVDGRRLQRGGRRQAGFDQQLQLLVQREARWAIRLRRVG